MTQGGIGRGERNEIDLSLSAEECGESGVISMLFVIVKTLISLRLSRRLIREPFRWPFQKYVTVCMKNGMAVSSINGLTTVSEDVTRPLRWPSSEELLQFE
jgi:hypothetical protein